LTPWGDVVVKGFVDLSSMLKVVHPDTTIRFPMLLHIRDNQAQSLHDHHSLEHVQEIEYTPGMFQEMFDFEAAYNREDIDGFCIKYAIATVGKCEY
jgi:hypothetical protein